MKKILLVFLFSLCLLPLVAQKNSNKYKILELNKLKAVYQVSSAFRDTTSMISSLISIVSAAPNDTGALRDLCKLYFITGNYNSAIASSRKYIELVPDNVEILRIFAISLQENQFFDEALLIYTELYYRTKESFFKYLAANMEYELFRQVESLKTIEACLALPNVDKDMISLPSNSSKEGVVWVSVKAACLNLQGLVLMDMKQEDKAKDSFNQAIIAAPNFDLPKENLRLIEPSQH